MQSVVTLDLEGVLVPEIWIAFAQKTGIDALRKTTRDEPDYDILMDYRLKILQENNLKLSDIQEVIGTLSPMDGAKDFLDKLRSKTQVIILSDTFLQFAKPLMSQLDWPTIFCHHLEVQDDVITNYCLRQPDQKRKSVEAFKALNFNVIAAGDSYNDTTMLAAADHGILFRAPDNVKAEFGSFQVTEEYDELMALVEERL